MSALEVGQKAPMFSLKSTDGSEMSLKSLEGKYVVLYFYPKDDTPGCTKEACAFRDRSDVFDEEDVTVLGVSADSIESHRKFTDKFDLNFPLLSDPDKKTINDYGVWQLKKLYGKESMGIVRTTYVIDPAGKIAKIFSKVKVDGHDEEVLEFIRHHKQNN